MITIPIIISNTVSVNISTYFNFFIMFGNTKILLDDMGLELDDVDKIAKKPLLIFTLNF